MALVHPSIPKPNIKSQAEPSPLDTARILYGLQQYRKSANILKDICKRDPSNETFKRELTNTIARLLEQQKGRYNFRSLYTEATSLRPPYLDRATYVGPVEVRDVEGMGRGLFTTRDVEAGELLVCEKAFAYSYTDGTEGGGNDGNGNSRGLARNVAKKLGADTHLLVSFNEIWHGDMMPTPILNGELIVDRILIEQAVSLNSFTGSLSTLSSHLNLTLSIPSSSTRSSGLWLLVARINHSCLSNCRRSFIGDMLIIRCAQNLPAHTELLCAYRIPDAQDHSYQTTQNDLAKYGFVCACMLCIDARTLSEDVVASRAQLRADLKSAFATGRVDGEFNCKKVDMARIEGILGELERTYTAPARIVPRTGLWDPYLALMRMYVIHAHPRKAIWAALKTLEMLGFVIVGADADDELGGLDVVKWGLVVDYLVELWLVLWTAYAKLEIVRTETQTADMAKEWAKVSYRVVVGEDDTFEESYGRKARKSIRDGELWKGC